jgi:hypothetical protein
MRSWMASMIMQPGNVTDAAFGAWLKADSDRWASLVRRSGFKGEA